MSTTTIFRYAVCIADAAGRGSRVAHRKTLASAQKALTKLEPEVGRPLGIWDIFASQWLVDPLAAPATTAADRARWPELTDAEFARLARECLS